MLSARIRADAYAQLLHKGQNILLIIFKVYKKPLI
jgi:hypothetical protein